MMVRCRSSFSVIFTLFSLAAVLSCGSDDTSPTTTDGGVTILIDASQSDWSAKTSYRTWGSDCLASSWVTDNPAIGRVLGNNRFGWEGNGLPEQYGNGSSCCYYSEYRSVAISTKMDLTPYETVRVKGRAVAYAAKHSGGCPPGRVGGSLVIDVLSNVPNTPNLMGVVAVDLDPVTCPVSGDPATEEVSFDVSLGAIALGFRQATLSLKLEFKCSCDGVNSTLGSFYVYDLRVLGEK